MTYIFIARHGPTIKKNGEKLLDEKKYKRVTPYIGKIISKFGVVDIIYTSPMDRCINTAKILNQIFDTTIHKREELSGSVSKKNYNNQSHNCFEFSKKVSKIDKNILIVTHSSVLRSALKGVCGYDVKEFHVNEASLSIYDKKHNKFILFNNVLLK